MIAQGIRLAQYGLWTLIAVLLVSVATPLRGREAPQVELVPLEPIRRAQAAFGRYTVIGNRNLFRVPEGAIPTAPIEEVIAESKLSLKLVGTAVSGNAARSNAIVEDARGKRTVVEANDVLESGVRVERIEEKRVIVLNGSNREAINMADDSATPSLAMLQSGRQSVARVEVIPPPPPAYIAVASRELAFKIASLLSPPAPRPKLAGATPPRSIAQRELPSENSGFPRTLDSARGVAGAEFSAVAGPGVRPAPGSGSGTGADTDSGQAAASQFQAVAGAGALNSLLSEVKAMKLRKGEEILAVNDIPVNASNRLPELLRSLVGADRATVQIAVDSNSVRIIEVALR